jgi:hypothetical protein
MTNYKLTAVTFKTTEEAYEFIATNIDSWAWVKFEGINQCHQVFTTYDDQFQEVCTTVVYCKKTRKPMKEVTRRDCLKALKDLYLEDEWDVMNDNGRYLLTCSRTGKEIKRASSWRGLRRVINSLGWDYRFAKANGNHFEWNRERGIW